MAAHAVTVSDTVAASPERLWQVITDIQAAPRTIPSITAVELLTEGPYGVGTRWRESRTVLGRTETHEMRVVESVPPHRTAVMAVSGRVEYTTTLQLSPEKHGTRLTLAFIADLPYAGRGRRVFSRAMARITVPLTRRMLHAELAEIRRAAENDRPLDD